MLPNGYQPFQGSYLNNGYNNMPNYNPYNYGQNYNQYSQFTQQNTMTQQIPNNDVLQGTFVDSLDVVKAKNCALDGSPTYYPKSDKTEIYCKQLNPQTGAGMILTYKLDTPTDTPQVSIEEQVATLLSNFKTDISNEIAEVKNLVQSSLSSSANTTATTAVQKKDNTTISGKGGNW